MDVIMCILAVIGLIIGAAVMAVVTTLISFWLYAGHKEKYLDKDSYPKK